MLAMKRHRGVLRYLFSAPGLPYLFFFLGGRGGEGGPFVLFLLRVSHVSKAI